MILFILVLNILFHEYGHHLAAASCNLSTIAYGIALIPPGFYAFIAILYLNVATPLKRIIIYSGGPFHNLLLAFLTLLVISYSNIPLNNVDWIHPNSVVDVQFGDVIDSVAGIPVTGDSSFIDILSSLEMGINSSSISKDVIGYCSSVDESQLLKLQNVPPSTNNHLSFGYSEKNGDNSLPTTISSLNLNQLTKIYPLYLFDIFDNTSQITTCHSNSQCPQSPSNNKPPKCFFPLFLNSVNIQMENSKDAQLLIPIFISSPSPKLTWFLGSPRSLAFSISLANHSDWALFLTYNLALALNCFAVNLFIPTSDGTTIFNELLRLKSIPTFSTPIYQRIPIKPKLLSPGFFFCAFTSILFFSTIFSHL